jgi:hypothetical protein
MSESCPRLGGIRLAPEVRQAPSGVPADAAAAYVQLISPILLADSLLTFPDPDWQSTDANVLPPSAEALAITRARAAEFLQRAEALLRRKAPEVLSVGEEILWFTWALLAQLPAWWTANDRAIAINSPDGQGEELLEKIRAKRAQECRRWLGEDPYQTLLSLVDRLRTAICKWADNKTTEAPAPVAPPAVEARASKRKRRRRASAREPAPLTPAQTEAMQLVGEHKGNVAAAARAAGKSRAAMKKLYDKATRKLGKKAIRHFTQRLPRDSRGQETIAAEEEA